jgi:hypothetical protein
MEFAALAEFIGFDIIFIGILTVIVARVGLQLWQQESNTRPGLCAVALKECGKLFGESTKQTAGILIIAALAGMTANFAADRLLDSGLLKWARLPEIEWDTKWEFNCGPPAEEDWVKVWALCEVLGKEVPTRAEMKILGKDSPTPEERKVLETITGLFKQAKIFFREGLATVLQSGSDALASSLRAEFLAVRVFRVLFLYALLLMLATLVATLRKWPKGQIVRSFATVLALLCLAYLSLWCWGHQSKRYYKKLGHAYKAVVAAPKNSPPRPTQ